MENRTAPLVPIKKQFMVHKFVNHFKISLNQQKGLLVFANYFIRGISEKCRNHSSSKYHLEYST